MNAIDETPKEFECGYGHVYLDDKFSGEVCCPATEGEERCRALLTFKIKSLIELSGSSGEIQQCTNPDSLEEHRVLIFTGKQDDKEFPFAQAVRKMDGLPIP